MEARHVELNILLKEKSENFKKNLGEKYNNFRAKDEFYDKK